MLEKRDVIDFYFSYLSDVVPELPKKLYPFSSSDFIKPLFSGYADNYLTNYGFSSIDKSESSYSSASSSSSSSSSELDLL